MTTSETPSRLRRRLRYELITLAACALTIALFYAEEDLRGWRAMEKCKRELEAQGVNLNWKSYIPAPVPEDENVFGVPEIQEGFTGRGAKQWPKKWPDRPNSPTRTVVAKLIIGLPGTTPPAGFAVLKWGDSKANEEETVRLIKEAVGPVALDPVGPVYTKLPPEEIRAAQIFFQCQTQPDKKDVEQLVPGMIFHNQWDANDKLKVEPTGDGSYNVTMHVSATAAEFLKSCEPIEPDLALIRNALQRPYARMNGDYSEPYLIPIPNFVLIRTISQRLGAMAECHLVAGQPEEALRDLTLTHDICRRILEDNQPMTLVSAMINVAVRGLVAGVIADGLKMHVWREPQLAALEQQLKPINLIGPVKQAFEGERISHWYVLNTKTPEQLYKLYHLSELVSGGSAKNHGNDHTAHPFRDKMNDWADSVGKSVHSYAWKLIPRGWAYQNMVLGMNLYDYTFAFLDPADKLIFQDKANARSKQADAAFSHWSPYNFLANAMVPNFIRAAETTSGNQTMVNQARIVGALERFHLAHGEYPETLDALIPRFIDAIPHDVIGGQPPHYRRNSDGTFLLYSIGWSGKDHGGIAGDYYGEQKDTDLVWPPKT